MENEIENQIINKSEKEIPHYYGDLVRMIFIIVGIVILIGLPTISEKLMISMLIPILAIVILGVSAGITNPKQLGSLFLNVIVSISSLIISIFISFVMYKNNFESFIFILNQIIAVLFLIAFYFSVKSLRGYILNK